MKGNKMRAIWRSVVGVLLVGPLLCSAATAWATQAASLQGLGGLGAVPPNTRPYGISGDGTAVVGRSSDQHDIGKAFRLQDGTMIDLGSGGSAVAHAASLDGSRVVGVNGSQAFLWTEPPILQPGPGLLLGLGFLQGGATSLAHDMTIRPGGSVVVVGTSNSFNGHRAFRWNDLTNAVMDLGTLDPNDTVSQALGVSADGTVVVGHSGNKAFRWVGNDTGGTMLALSGQPAGTFTSGATGVSADGLTIIGQSAFHSGGDEAFRWTEGTGVVGLGFLPGETTSQALAISDDGLTIVGSSGSAFVWRADIGMRSVHDVLTGAGVNVTNWTLGDATGVSADGLTIVGGGLNPSGENEGWITMLPDCNGNGIFDESDIASGTSPDINADGIPDECQPPLVLAVGSAKFHQATPIRWGAKEIPAGDSECRNIGATLTINVVFDRDVFSQDGNGFVVGDFTVQNGRVTLVQQLFGPKTLRIDMDNVNNAACFTISFAAKGVNNNEGLYAFEWPILLGDANNNGVVDAADQALLGGNDKNGKSIWLPDSVDSRCDLNFSGVIEGGLPFGSGDLGLVVVTSPPASASCP